MDNIILVKVTKEGVGKMDEVGKLFLYLGILFIVAGLLIIIVSKTNIPLGKLPGDIYIKKDNFTFYFPITTSLLLSLFISLLFLIFARKQ
jgi:hypothetical protein